MKKSDWTQEHAAKPETGYTQERYAAKKPTLVWIALLLILMAPAALFASARTPQTDAVSTQIGLWMHGEEDRGAPVNGLLEIEDAWAIEDTRGESAEPLITRMFRDGEILGWDRESRTFYCSLSADSREEWPEIALTAQGEAGVQAAWIDDYTYDFCSDAVAEGYRYELLAYTDTAFEYIGVVFTGLPIMTIHTDGGEAIVQETDVGADIHMASGAGGALYSRALAHRRGGNAYVGVPKHSYRIEFRGLDLRGSERRMERSVLDMEPDSDWLLIGNSSDVSAIRNHLCWQVWKAWKPERQIAELESRLIELFVGDEYMGIYQLMQYVNPEKEMRLMGGNPDTDVLARLITMPNQTDRPVWNRVNWDTHKLELRHIPTGMSAEEAFELYVPFSKVEILLTDDMSDEEFAAIMGTHFDMQELLDYFLFVQMYGLTDNVLNNLYIWALRQPDGTYRYRISPWDMDQSLGSTESRIGEGDLVSREMWMIERMLDMDLNGCRKTLWEMFREKREGVLSDEAIYQWLVDVEEDVNATGAYLRESEKWRGGAQALDLTEMRVKMMEFQQMFEDYGNWLWPLEEES